MHAAMLWGYHIDEYQQIFNLDDVAQDTHWLEYQCGITAVNAQRYAQHLKTTSCDPLFSLDKKALVKQAQHSIEKGKRDICENRTHYDFSGYGSAEALLKKRNEGMEQCLADYEKGRIENRYLSIDEQRIPFDDFSFDLALSASYLFNDVVDHHIDFHLQTIQELARVAKEVRIFPLVDQSGRPSAMLGPVLLGLQQRNYGVEIRDVNYRLLRGHHAMLRVWARECLV